MADFDPASYASGNTDFDPTAYAKNDEGTAADAPFDPSAYAQDDAPASAPEAEPVDLTAYKAAQSPLTSDAAAQALKVAKQTGTSPQFAADTLDQSQRQLAQRDIAGKLANAPVTAAFAAQSPVHAALVKDDVGPLEALEQGLFDLGYQERAALQMSLPSDDNEQVLRGYEDEVAQYDKKRSPWYADLLRNAVPLGEYYLAGIVGHAVGGKAGELAATGGMMFALNRGVLYRRIIHEMPIPASDDDPAAVGWKGVQDYEQKARVYATAGAGVSAALGTGLSSAVGLAVPGAVTRISNLSNGLIARAFTDAATRGVVTRLAEIGGHTLSGALMMAVPAVVDDATVQKAVRGEVDAGQAAAAGWEAFKGALLAAGVLSTAPHAVGLVHDVGRAFNAKPEAERLQSHVDNAKATKIVTQAPDEAKALIGNMAAVSDTPAVHIDPEALAKNPEANVAATKVVGPQAVAEAHATGADLAVPIEDYLTSLADHHDALKNDVKLTADGMTPRQAQEWQEAFHGTPHQFAEFDLSKIGTGTGAALYGHGMHFSETQEGAETYQRTASSSGEGNLFRAAIPGSEELLDWDKPLAEQPAGVASKLRQAGLYEGLEAAAAKEPERSVYRLLQDQKGSPEAASETLRQAGIPGLQHAEETTGAKNFVVWDDSRMRILAHGEQLPGEEAPQPRLPFIPKDSLEDTAARMIESKTIEDIQPSRYERAAETAARRATALRLKAVDVLSSAEETAQEGIDHATDAAETARRGAGNLGMGLAQARELDARGAGKAAQKLARTQLRESTRGQTRAEAASERATKGTVRAGDAMAQAEAHEQARDLSLALAAKATEVRGEMDKLQEKLVRGYNDLSRKKLRQADPAYLGATDVLMGAVGLAPEVLGAQNGIPEALARMEYDAIPVAFDEAAIRDLVNSPRDFEKLTPAEARNVSDAIANIRAAARQASEIGISDRKASLREVVAQIGQDSENRKDKGAPPVTDSALSPGEALMRKAGAFNADNLKPETISEFLGETAHRVYEKLIDARNYKAELQGDVLRHFEEKFGPEMRSLAKDLKKPIRTSLEIPKSVDLEGSKVNRETLAMAFLNLGTASNEQRLLGGYQWDKEQLVQEIGKNLPKETVRFLQAVLSYNDEKLWPLVKEHAEKTTGVAPPKVVAQPITIAFADGTTETFDGGYFPAAPNPDALSLPNRGADGIQNLDAYARTTVSASFTKTRAAQASYPVDLNWSRYPSHLASVLHYLAYDEPVRDIGKLLRDDEFRSIVQHKVGKPYLDQLDDDLRIWARGNTSDSTRSISMVSQMVGGVFRSRAISNAIGFSAPIVMGQESHIQYAITSGEISAKNGSIAMGRALIPETWSAALENSSELRFRADHYAALFREALSGKNTKSDILKKTDVAAFAMMDGADRVLSHVVWDAAYNDAKDTALSHEDAVRQADRKVRKLMPTHNQLEMAPIVRDRGLIGSLMLFRGLPNVVWNVEAGLFDQAQQAGQGYSGLNASARVGGRVALNTARAVGSIAALHMLGRLLMGHGKQDEDGTGLPGWGHWAEREAIAAQFARVPLGRDTAEPFVDAAVQGRPMAEALRELKSGKHLQPDVAVLYGMLSDLGKLASDKASTEDQVQAGVNATMTALGAGGLRHLTSQGRYLYDLHNENVDARGPFDVAGGTIYGQRPHQAKNLFTGIQDFVSGE